MSLINLDALRAAQLHTDPYDFLVVPGFLGADALAQEHAYLSLQNLYRALNNQTILSQLPAFKLLTTNGPDGENR